MHFIVIAFTIIVGDTLKGAELYQTLYQVGYYGALLSDIT